MGKLLVEGMVVGMVGTNCYLVYDDGTKRAVVVDPGDNAPAIMQKAQERGVKPEAILLTHGHFDHIMAAEELRRAWKAPVYAAQKEREILSDSAKNMMESFCGEPLSLEPDVTLQDNEVFEVAGMTFRMMETPGHTIGSCCYYMEKEGILFSGDTLFQMSYGRTDFPTGSGKRMAMSVTRLLSELPDKTIVYPGHMDSTTIGFEKQNNPMARFLR